MASNTNGGRRSQIANYILIIAAIVLLLSYPFQDFFSRPDTFITLFC